MLWSLDLCGSGAAVDAIDEVDIRGQDRILGI